MSVVSSAPLVFKEFHVSCLKNIGFLVPSCDNGCKVVDILIYLNFNTCSTCDL